MENFSWHIGSCSIFRAAIVYGRVRSGQNVLITGIGGGVALTAMQICVARGASVYVTSGSQDRIQKAITFGAKGGANYKDSMTSFFCRFDIMTFLPFVENWPSHIGTMLARNGSSDGVLDVVIDSGGGDIMTQTSKILKRGGRVVCYGMY
jgi:NADPH:quinone reductase-like Zn-dependent oxidoreductase